MRAYPGPLLERCARREVEVTFVAEGDGTRVTLEHRGFEVHGDAGWSALLELYRDAA
jgi:hypothetical protein